MKKILATILSFVSLSSFAGELQINSVFDKISKESRKDGREYLTSSLEAYEDFKTHKKDVHDSFINEVKEFRREVKHNFVLKTLLKTIKKECRKDSTSSECIENTDHLKSFFAKIFRNRFLTVGLNELHADRFLLIAGMRDWENSDTLLDLYPGMYGIGFEFARSIINVTVCTLPTSNAKNAGVTISAVLGLGITTGLYIGMSGICFDFGLMYGIGAYTAVSILNVNYEGPNRPQDSDKCAFPPQLSCFSKRH